MRTLLENPEFMRYFRSHTRRGRATTYYTLFLIGCCACLAINLLFYYKLQAYRDLTTCVRSVFFQIIATNFLFLLSAGAHACGDSVSSERQSNTLEFQRITGMSSYTLAFGKILGVPFIHYLMAAVGMPVTMLCVICGGVSLMGWIVSYFLLLLTGLFFCSAATLVSANRRGKTAQRTSPILLLVVLLPLGPAFGMTVFRGLGGMMGSESGIWTCLLPFHTLWAVGQDSLDTYRVAFFGARLNGAVSTLVMNAFLFLMAWAGTARRLASDSQSLWTKPQLLAGSSVVFLLLGGYLWNALPAAANPRVPVAVCTIAAHLVLAIAATVGSPGLYAFRLGLRQQTAGGPRRFPLVDERALAIPLVVTLAIAYSGMVLAIDRASTSTTSAGFSISDLAAVFVPLGLCGIIYTLIAQLLKLLAPERGVKLLGAILFVWAVVPAVAGSMLQAWHYSIAVTRAGDFVLSLSPVGSCVRSLPEVGVESLATWPFLAAMILWTVIAVWLWLRLARYRAALRSRFCKSVSPTGAPH